MHLHCFIDRRRCLLAGLAGLCAPAPGMAAAAHPLVTAARRQIGITTGYDPAYRRLAYPGGDVPAHTGVCTDVVIRAWRALGQDLQVLVHQDMLRAFAQYPRHWGLKRPDHHIDHRRVPNLQTFFKRQGASLPVSQRPADYRAGDMVTWLLPGKLPHIGIVSNRQRRSEPLVIHNIGQGVQEEPLLLRHSVTGHYRWRP